MQRDVKPFRIYSASAGSGKTYTLCREYLKILLEPRGRRAFREILAITFTNKAVGELKARILESLETFSRGPEVAEKNPMFHELRDALGIEADALCRKAGGVLQEILHNYAFFDVSTIDRFNHRVIRTFARDLDLPSNFEVVLDTVPLLERAVHNLILKAGTESELTRVLVDFALEKSADDRSWDISLDLRDTGKLLFSENNLPFLATLSGKGIADFENLRALLQDRVASGEKRILALAREILVIISENGLVRLDFNRGWFPDFISKLAAGEFDQDFESAGWKQNFGAEPLYTKSKPDTLKSLLDRLLPEFSVRFHEIRRQVYQRDFHSNAHKNIAPFTVLGLLKQELDQILETEGLLPIAYFNAIISAELSGQPAPYLYERLGEKYRHYFIDEFQDTSELQWKNLVPLIASALEGEDEQGRSGSLVLVGDAKQAIYRWRGGRAEQFMGLADGPGNPFTIPAALEPLPRNFRSRKSIVEFNNSFFQSVSRHLGSAAYSQLYMEGNRQVPNSGLPGLVHLEFLAPDSEDSGKDYEVRTLAIVRELQESGYPLMDICILTRKREEGVILARVLMESGIEVVSSETLLLQNHPAIAFLIDILSHLADPADGNHRFGILCYLAPDGPQRHDWISNNLGAVHSLLGTEWGFDTRGLALKPTYEILETAIRQFNLAGEPDAYLVALLDEALKIARDGDTSILTFLHEWDLGKEKLSIAAPENRDAVRLMTIHASKGLEFPVVIFPFADTDLHFEVHPKLWIPVDPESYAGFPYLQVRSRKALVNYGEVPARLYLEEREKLELDACNVLYVVHTRAVEALFVLTGGRAPRLDRAPGHYPDLYAQYLLETGQWDPDRLVYRFGDLYHTADEKQIGSQHPLKFGYTARDRELLEVHTRSGRLWGSRQEEALAFGNTVHYALSLIRSKSDVSDVVRSLVREGLIREGERGNLEELLGRIVEHPLLESFYRPGLSVFNEREIILKNGLFLRPDRLVLGPGNPALIDYKTGLPRPAHQYQLRAYAGALEEMGYTGIQTILVYIGQDDIAVEYL